MHSVRPSNLILDSEIRLKVIQTDLQKLASSSDSSKDTVDDETKGQIMDLNTLVKEEKIKLKALKEIDWQTLLALEIDQMEPRFKKSLPLRNYNTFTWPTLFTDESLLNQYKWMYDKKVTPIYPLDFSWVTTYDEVFQDEIIEKWVLKNIKYSSSGIYYLHHLFGLLFSFIGTCFFLFFFSDIVTKEGFRRNGPIHLLHTQPIHRHNILIGKFTTVILMTVFILTGIITLSLLIGTVFDRFGDWNYPVLIYGQEYSFTFMNLSMFLSKSVILFFMILLFCYSLLFLYSILTNKAVVALGLTIITLFIGLKWSEEAVSSSFATYVPFHYFSVSEVITNELAVTVDNFAFSFTNGVTILCLSSVVILLVSFVLSSLQYKHFR